MYKDLSKEKCEPCELGRGHLMASEIEDLLKQVPDWSWEEHHRLAKEFAFEDFKSALDFVNQVGALAEEEGHHPDIFLTWGKVKVTLFTHKIDGLTENDFIMAIKIDKI